MKRILEDFDEMRTRGMDIVPESAQPQLHQPQNKEHEPGEPWAASFTATKALKSALRNDWKDAYLQKMATGSSPSAGAGTLRRGERYTSPWVSVDIPALLTGRLPRAEIRGAKKRAEEVERFFGLDVELFCQVCADVVLQRVGKQKFRQEYGEFLEWLERYLKDEAEEASLLRDVSAALNPPNMYLVLANVLVLFRELIVPGKPSVSQSPHQKKEFYTMHLSSDSSIWDSETHLDELLRHIRDLGFERVLVLGISLEIGASSNPPPKLQKLVSAAVRFGLSVIIDGPLPFVSEGHPWFQSLIRERKCVENFLHRDLKGNRGLRGYRFFAELNLSFSAKSAGFLDLNFSNPAVLECLFRDIAFVFKKWQVCGIYIKGRSAWFSKSNFDFESAAAPPESGALLDLLQLFARKLSPGMIVLFDDDVADEVHTGARENVLARSGEAGRASLALHEGDDSAWRHLLFGPYRKNTIFSLENQGGEFLDEIPSSLHDAVASVGNMRESLAFFRFFDIFAKEMWQNCMLLLCFLREHVEIFQGFEVCLKSKPGGETYDAFAVADWSSWMTNVSANQDAVSFISELIQVRHSLNPQGRNVPIFLDVGSDQALAFAREKKGGKGVLIVVVSHSENPLAMRMNAVDCIVKARMPQGTFKVVNLIDLGNNEVSWDSESMEISMNPYGLVVFELKEVLDCESASREKVPDSTESAVLVKWNGRASSVLLTGSFLDWKLFIPLQWVPEKDSHVSLLYLSPGSHELKFVVDNRWVSSMDMPLMVPGDRTSNNLLQVGKAIDPLELSTWRHYLVAAASREMALAESTVLRPMVFLWIQPAKTVSIAGTFNNWSSMTPMNYSKDGNYFWLLLYALPGRYDFRFFVDGTWKIASEQPHEYDSSGFVSNFVTV